jgi:type IX secretion system PorP/SprF family membrane protein
VKQLIAVIFFLAVLNVVVAQQRPYYTQYVLNNFLLNPAVAGIENYTDIKLSHRLQWVGLQDAPVTTYFTIHGSPSKRMFDVDRTNPTTVKPYGRNVMLESYEPADPHHGLGFTMVNDVTGPLSRFSATATYAYHLQLNSATNLSMGASVGISQMRLDASKLTFDNPNDPAVASSGIINKITPDINVGLWLYGRDYFVGLAAQQIMPQPVTYSATGGASLETGKMVPHIFAQAGYRWYLNDDIAFMPSVLVRYISPVPIGFDINAKFEYNNTIWLGANYRKDDGFAAMMGVNLNHSINIGYSYDITTSRLNTISRGTHEILVGFLLGNRYNDWRPRNAW